MTTIELGLIRMYLHNLVFVKKTKEVHKKALYVLKNPKQRQVPDDVHLF